MPLETGVIGAGTVAENNHLPAVSRNPRTRLVAVCDADGERAREAGFAFGARPYVDVATMLDDEELDWVHVATPVGTHRDLAGAAIEAGVATTLQKPATVTLDELDELLSLADRRGVPVTVVHNWLYYPSVRELRRRVERGEIGRVRAVEVTVAGEGAPDETYRGPWVFDLPGGEFEEGMPHALYLAVAFGGDPQSRETVDVRTRLAGEYDREIAYDGVTVQYESERDALCTVTFLSGSARGQTVRVHGEAGALVADLASRTVRYHDPEAGPYHFFQERVERNVGDVASSLGGLATNLLVRAKERLEERFDRHLETSPDGHYAQLDATATALQHGRQPPVPLDRSRWPIAIMERVRESSAEVVRARP